MATVECSACSAKISVKPEHLGKRAKCPKCHAAIDLVELPPIRTPSPIPVVAGPATLPPHLLMPQPQYMLQPLPSVKEDELPQDESAPIIHRSRPTPRKKPRRGPGVQTVEATGKQWKAMMLFGGFGMLAAVISAGAFAYKASQDADYDIEKYRIPMQYCAVLFSGSAFGYFVGRIGAWWFHG